jgi:hypothetical protein
MRTLMQIKASLHEPHNIPWRDGASFNQARPAARGPRQHWSIMYEPAGRHFPNLAMLWPAFAAASASEMAALAARQFADFAVGPAAPAERITFYIR